MAILIISRPEPAASRFLDDVKAAVSVSVKGEITPLIAIQPLDVSLPDVPISGIILTSASGAVQAVRLGLPTATTAWCVGDQTAQTATEFGFAARSAQGNAEDLCRMILAARPAGHLIHIRGEHARGDICARLTRAGLNCTDLIAYRQRPLPPTAAACAALTGTEAVVLPLFSPRTANLLKEIGNLTAPLHVIAMSKAVVVAFSGVPVQSLILSAKPDRLSMTLATCRVLTTLGNG